MTNKEWLIQNINEKLEEDNKFLKHVEEEYSEMYGLIDWCELNHKNKCVNSGDCNKCFTQWCERIYQKPLPKLKDGMFVKVYVPSNSDAVEHGDGKLGIIIGDKIYFMKGKPVDINKYSINVVYNSESFEECCSETIIWYRSV